MRPDVALKRRDVQIADDSDAGPPNPKTTRDQINWGRRRIGLNALFGSGDVGDHNLVRWALRIRYPRSVDKAVAALSVVFMSVHLIQNFSPLQTAIGEPSISARRTSRYQLGGL